MERLQDIIGNVGVSTAYNYGLPVHYDGPTPPGKYETAIILNPQPDKSCDAIKVVEFYWSWEEAQAGHKRWLGIVSKPEFKFKELVGVE